MASGVRVRDDGLSKLQQQRAELEKRIQDERQRRMLAIGRIFEKLGLNELSDEVIYGICDEIRTAGLASDRVRQLAERGAKIAPQKPGRKKPV